MSGTKTSSPGPISKANNAQYKPKVPLATEIAYLAPVKSRVIDSNSFVILFSVIKVELITFVNSSSSNSFIQGCICITIII